MADTLNSTPVTRRRLLALVGGAGVALVSACAQQGACPAPAKPADVKPAADAQPTAAAAAKPAESKPAAQAAPAKGTQMLTIGAAVALTGGVAKEGNQAKDGYEFWQKTVNDAGGVDVGGTKHSIELVVYDDESKADTASRLTEKLISDDKAQFILGPFSSAITQATTTISERYGVLTIAPLANADSIYERGYKYVFSILPPASSYLRNALDMAATLDPKPIKTAIMMRDDAFGIAAGEGAAKDAPGHGFDVVFKDKYPANATDVSTILTQVKAANPDMFLASTLFQDAVLITKQAKDLQFNPKMFAFTAGPAIPDFVNSLGKDAEGVIGSEWWLPSLQAEGPVFGSAQQYSEAITKAKGYPANYFVAAGSVAGLVLQLGIEKAGKLETDAVRAALLDMDPKTFWGPLGWDETGKNVKGAGYPSQIQDGALRGVWPADVRDAPVRYPFPAWSGR